MTDPQVVVFDVNGTLSDLTPMTARFADVGAPASLSGQWFASVLRDGFALAVGGGQAPFADVADAALRTVLAGTSLDRDLDAAVEHILAGFGGLPVHADVAAGVRALRAAGHRLVTLSNGATRVAERLLDGAGIRQEFEALLSVADAGRWKPAEPAYAYAAARCGVPPAGLVMVAAHPWDIDGAARAGLTTAWLDRGRTPYPPFFVAPTVTVPALGDLPEALAGLRR